MKLFSFIQHFETYTRPHIPDTFTTLEPLFKWLNCKYFNVFRTPLSDITSSPPVRGDFPFVELGGQCWDKPPAAVLCDSTSFIAPFQSFFFFSREENLLYMFFL